MQSGSTSSSCSKRRLLDFFRADGWFFWWTLQQLGYHWCRGETREHLWALWGKPAVEFWLQRDEDCLPTANHPHHPLDRWMSSDSSDVTGCSVPHHICVTHLRTQSTLLNTTAAICTWLSDGSSHNLIICIFIGLTFSADTCCCNIHVTPNLLNTVVLGRCIWLFSSLKETHFFSGVNKIWCFFILA